MTERSSIVDRTVRMLLDQRVPVIPVHGPHYRGSKPGKKPYAYPPGVTRPNPITGSETSVIHCLDYWSWTPYAKLPAVNLAIAGVCQVDADDAAAARKAAELGVSRELGCWIVTTRRGRKALFNPPQDPRLRNRTKSGGFELDLILPPAPCVIPPSVHRTGHVYTWVEGHSPWDIPRSELAELPPLLLEWWALLCEDKRPRDSSRPQPSMFELRTYWDALVLAVEGKTGRRLVRRGENLDGCCPLHEDRNPSFSMHPDRGWICRSACGEGSLDELGRRLGVENPRHGRGRNLRIGGP